MKKFIILVIGSFITLTSFADSKFSPFRGVWASDKAEAVITDSVCIFYAQVDSTMLSFIEIPSAGIFHSTSFTKGGNVSFNTIESAPSITLAENILDINGFKLQKVEDIEIVEPYEMTKCNYKLDVGKCLQEWRLGTKYGVQNGMPYCEICTNRNMFVYMVNPTMVYIRAAAYRNNNNGTLFFQNVRMMKNSNTGEYTMRIEPDNLNIVKNDLEIDNSKFNPDACTFNPDGDIYWSLISYTTEQIQINGCGETYYIDRMPIDAPLTECSNINHIMAYRILELIE